MMTYCRNPDELVVAAHELGVDLMILGYRTTRVARRIRKQYYRCCGFSGRWASDRDKVSFHSTEDWISIAFRERWLVKHLREAGYDVTLGRFGRIGLVAHAHADLLSLDEIDAIGG